jgi:hypothetical protein
MTMKHETEQILGHRPEFLKYLKSKFTLIHMSNFFFRDFHFGIMAYLKEHGMKPSYAGAESIAVEVGEAFERDGVFKRVDHQSWLLNYPEFALPKIEKKAS